MVTHDPAPDPSEEPQSAPVPAPRETVDAARIAKMRPEVAAVLRRIRNA